MYYMQIKLFIPDVVISVHVNRWRTGRGHGNVGDFIFNSVAALLDVINDTMINLSHAGTTIDLLEYLRRKMWY